jgi:hypothetical protein
MAPVIIFIIIMTIIRVIMGPMMELMSKVVWVATKEVDIDSS